MPARVRARLTYANVVATLALFLALGGSSYAVSQITSRDVKNRSLKGGDVKLNTLTGKEINESKMGEVPSAQSARNALTATTAASADIAKNAGAATTAQNAITAASADVAKDAQALAGQGAGAFEKSSRTSFGKASPADPAGTSGEKVILSWPELGVTLRTAVDQASCGAGTIRLGVGNTKASGPTAFMFEQGTESVKASALPGTVGRECVEVGSGQITDETGRTLFFDCRVFLDETRCLGVRSEP